MLLHDFLDGLGLSQCRLAHDISVPPRRINEIVHGKCAVSEDAALRLARYFGTSPQFCRYWQRRDDLDIQQDKLGARLRTEVRVCAAAS